MISTDVVKLVTQFSCVILVCSSCHNKPNNNQEQYEPHFH